VHRIRLLVGGPFGAIRAPGHSAWRGSSEDIDEVLRRP